jgi:hypothetical protein
VSQDKGYITIDKCEIEKELSMTYEELVSFLLEKYGNAKYDFFCNYTCKSKNPKVRRTKEGLFCHHIDEKIIPLLCKQECARKFSYDYQKADRLVYCNILEHLILHIKIYEFSKRKKAKKKKKSTSIGGILTISQQINDYFDGVIFKEEYLIKTFELIENNFEDYINVLTYFLNLTNERHLYKEALSGNWNGKTVKKIYERL